MYTAARRRVPICIRVRPREGEMDVDVGGKAEASALLRFAVRVHLYVRERAV